LISSSTSKGPTIFPKIGKRSGLLTSRCENDGEERLDLDGFYPVMVEALGRRALPFMLLQMSLRNAVVVAHSGAAVAQSAVNKRFSR
jgi:hypothetical protein